MNPALADYTPVAVGFLPEPLLTWADLRGVRFEEPFFRDTLRRAAQGQWKAMTGIDELRALDARPTLAPSLFVFQSSRCGSTLLAQMLTALPTNVVLSEATFVNDILAAQRPPAEKVELLRLTLRASGRNRGDDARRLIVKLSSWNVLQAEVLHAAFPDTPLLWLQRDPLAVAASQAAQPAGWMGWRETGAPMLSLFGLTADAALAMPAARFRLHALEALYRAVHETRLGWQVVDYTALPDALWGKIAAHARWSFDAPEVELMQARARFDSKATGDTPFVARDRTAVLFDEEKQLIEERIAPLYRAIGHQQPQP